MQSMAVELTNQMKGKSVSTVIKNWPETEAIFKTLYEMAEPDGMTTPLDAIIKRHMPAMLAAPTA